MPEKLVFGHPHLPHYQLAWNADSTYKTENKKKEEAERRYKRRNITITEPKHVERCTETFCMRPTTKQEMPTEKKTYEQYLG
jgi:hypothetical protein